jgi:hypothetical protein
MTLEEASLPTDRVRPFDCLREPQRAFRCRGWEGRPCTFISVNRQIVSRHCNGHGWRSSAKEKEHWDRVAVQSFHPTSRSPQWFVVDVGDDSGSATNETNEARPAGPTQRQTILQEFQRLAEKRKRELDVVDALPVTDVTGWWKRTG